MGWPIAIASEKNLRRQSVLGALERGNSGYHICHPPFRHSKRISESHGLFSNR